MPPNWPHFSSQRLRTVLGGYPPRKPQELKGSDVRMSSDQGKPKHRPKGKSEGLQWDLEQELKEKTRRGEKDVDNLSLTKPGGGEGSNTLFKNRDINTPLPPLPPPPPQPCLFGDPETRETVRRKLKELGVTNIYQLIRTYSATDLIEAISDFERALDEGMRIKSPTGYFKSLLE